MHDFHDNFPIWIKQCFRICSHLRLQIHNFNINIRIFASKSIISLFNFLSIHHSIYKPSLSYNPSSPFDTYIYTNVYIYIYITFSFQFSIQLVLT